MKHSFVDFPFSFRPTLAHLTHGVIVSCNAWRPSWHREAALSNFFQADLSFFVPFPKKYLSGAQYLPRCSTLWTPSLSLRGCLRFGNCRTPPVPHAGRVLSPHGSDLWVSKGTHHFRRRRESNHFFQTFADHNTLMMTWQFKAHNCDLLLFRGPVSSSSSAHLRRPWYIRDTTPSLFSLSH